MTETSIISALAKALPELDGAKKDAINPHFKNKYATLGSVIDAIEPIRKHGLWYRQISHQQPSGVCVETIYIHESGQELSAGELFLPADKQNAQGFGSAMTYARRYSLQTAFGLDAEDDDGNAASKPKVEKPQPKITDEQYTLIQEMLEGAGIPQAELLKAAKVAKVTDIEAANFERVKTWINKKIEAMKEEQNA